MVSQYFSIYFIKEQYEKCFRYFDTFQELTFNGTYQLMYSGLVLEIHVYSEYYVQCGFLRGDVKNNQICHTTCGTVHAQYQIKFETYSMSSDG